MPVTPRVSPLPPDRAGHGHSPLPPDPVQGGCQPGSRVSRDRSPLPPDPGPEWFPALPRPRTRPR